MAVMSVKLKNRILVFALVLTSVAAGPVSADTEFPEYGFKGMKRIELAYVNDGASGADDLAQNKECKAIAVALGNAGLEIAPKCKPDDAACGTLSLTLQDQSEGRTADRVYLVGVVLSQPVTLVRDKDKQVQLSTPMTWSQYRAQVVPNDKSATEAACRSLRSIATAFGSQWRVANK